MTEMTRFEAQARLTRKQTLAQFAERQAHEALVAVNRAKSDLALVRLGGDRPGRWKEEFAAVRAVGDAKRQLVQATIRRDELCAELEQLQRQAA